MTTAYAGIYERLPIRPLIPRHLWGDKNTPFVDLIIDSDAYQFADTDRQQWKVLYQIGQRLGLSANYLAKMMDVDHKSCMKQVNAPSDYNPPGRPTILKDNEKDEFLPFYVIC